MLLLKGRKALITGGTAGIGKAIAIVFAEQGADVAILGTNPERGKTAVEEISLARADQEQKVLFRPVDVSNYSDVEKAIQEILVDWGSIDTLVNNAGITRDGLLLRMSEKDWDDVISVNLKSAYNTCRCLMRSMMKGKFGKVINVASVIGLTGNAGQVNYAASKSGMIGFTKSLAKEFAGKNILVNCIAPGYIKTEMTDKLSEQVKEGVLSSIPLKRIGSPLEIAQGALFLASHLSDYITGQVLTIDGGMVM